MDRGRSPGAPVAIPTFYTAEPRLLESCREPKASAGWWIEEHRANCPRISLLMCRTSGDDGSSVGSRSTSDSSDHSEVLPLEEISSFDKSSTYPAAGWWPPPRASRGAVVALVCALSAAVGLSLCGGCFRGLCWTNDGGGKKPNDGSKLLKMSDGVDEVSACMRRWSNRLKGLPRAAHRR